jgi:hypothetical protein
MQSYFLYGSRLTSDIVARAVAGLAACFLSSPYYQNDLTNENYKVAEKVQALIKKLSYSRVRGQPKVLYNRVGIRPIACLRPNNKR